MPVRDPRILLQPCFQAAPRCRIIHPTDVRLVMIDEAENEVASGINARPCPACQLAAQVTGQPDLGVGTSESPKESPRDHGSSLPSPLTGQPPCLLDYRPLRTVNVEPGGSEALAVVCHLVVERPFLRLKERCCAP